MKRTKYSDYLLLKRTKPGKWNNDRCRQVFELALLGLIDKKIAQAMDVSVQTIDNWKRRHPEFLEAMRAGKDKADAKVVKALYEVAIGYSHPDVHVSNYKGEITITPITKHYPPNPYAGYKWLTIRQRKIWAEVNKSIPPPANLTQINFNMFTKQEKLALEKIGMIQLIEQGNINND